MKVKLYDEEKGSEKRTHDTPLSIIVESSVYNVVFALYIFFSPLYSYLQQFNFTLQFTKFLTVVFVSVLNLIFSFGDKKHLKFKCYSQLQDMIIRTFLFDFHLINK